jgi:hypothetical protein
MHKNTAMFFVNIVNWKHSLLSLLCRWKEITMKVKSLHPQDIMAMESMKKIYLCNPRKVSLKIQKWLRSHNTCAELWWYHCSRAARQAL